MLFQATSSAVSAGKNIQRERGTDGIVFYQMLDVYSHVPHPFGSITAPEIFAVSTRCLKSCLSLILILCGINRQVSFCQIQTSDNLSRCAAQCFCDFHAILSLMSPNTVRRINRIRRCSRQRFLQISYTIRSSRVH